MIGILSRGKILDQRNPDTTIQSLARTGEILRGIRSGAVDIIDL